VIKSTRPNSFAVAVCLAASLLGHTLVRASPEPEPIPIKVVVISYLSYAPLFIAQEAGYFAEQGLAVELLHVNRISAALPALVQGDIDVLPAAIMPAYINVVSRGGKIKIVAGKGYYSTKGCAYSGIMARRSLVESGVLGNPSDLAGLRVSTERTSPSYYRFQKLLHSGNLTLDDVRVVDIPAAAKLDAFETGALDVTTSSEPWVTRIMRTGFAVLWARTSDFLPNFQFGYIVYGPSLLAQESKAGVLFLSAYLRAVRRLNRDGKSPRNLQILAKHTGLDEDILKDACWPSVRDDGRVHAESLQEYQTWALAQGLIDSEISINELVDPRFIEAANRLLAEPADTT
jgi:NitT/TauT family transport system substrate-binding protein